MTSCFGLNCCIFFFLNHPPTTEFSPLPLHDALPIGATARAADPHLRKSASAARLAKTIFEQLRRAAVSPFLKEPKMETVLRAAAMLHGIEPENARSEEHTSELQSQSNLVCRLLLEKK